MPYPESCPECGGVFRNTGTHFTARRNEIGRHVLLELGCQNTSRRFWWDFTTASVTEDGRTVPGRRASSLAAVNGALRPEHNGHITLSTLDRPASPADLEIEIQAETDPEAEIDSSPEPAREVYMDAVPSESDSRLIEAMASLGAPLDPDLQLDGNDVTTPLAIVGGSASPAPALKDAFLRQLQLDRLTLRQMRSWLMSDDARRAIEVAAGATEATYERLALILFGTDLPHLLGKQTAAPVSTGLSAEERLELQREKARIRARLRRAAAKVARQQAS